MSERVFLSYAHEDQALVEWEARTLTIAGAEVFLDTQSLRYGSEWPRELIKEVQAAKRFLLFWSSYAAQSEWVRNEYEEAFRVRASRGDDQFLQILKLDGAPLPPPLDTLHYLDRSREELLIVASETSKESIFDGGLKKLLLKSAIIKFEKTTPRTTKVIFDEAAALTSTVPGQVQWSLKRSPKLPPSLTLPTFKWKDSGEAEKHPLILVPGMMGSELAADGGLIWMDFAKLMVGGIARLKIEEPGVRPVGLIGQTYSSFVNQVVTTTKVVPCPYDWRLSFEDSSRALADVVRTVLDQSLTFRPAIVAHGSGSFVVRALAAFHPELWTECRARELRLVFVGAPEHGSYLAAEILSRSSRSLSMLGLLDLTHTARDVENIFAKYPSVLQHLPQGPEQDLLDPAFWRGTDFEIDSSALATARKIRAAMATSIPSSEIHYIYGAATETVTHISVKGSLVRKRSSPRGDGWAPYDLTFPDSLPERIYFANDDSASLLGNPAVIRAITDLASHGATAVLSSHPPEARKVQRRVKSTKRNEWPHH